MTDKSQLEGAAVAVLGTGLMGSTLARTLARAGCRVTVWNRTAERAHDLVTSGCVVVDTPAGALASSPLAIVCVLDDSAVDGVLAARGARAALTGVTVVNATTESPEASRRHGDAVRSHGGAYLGAGILGHPRMIGTPEAVILYSGNPDRFAEHAETLALLAGGQRHVGVGDADAAAAYAASWTYYFGGLGGFFEAAAYMMSIGVPVQDFASLAEAMTSLLLDGIKDAADRVAAGNYTRDQGDVFGHVEGNASFMSSISAAGARADILSAFDAYCRLAADAGHEREDVAAVVTTLVSEQRGK